MLSDIEIAQRATLRPIQETAARLGLGDRDLLPYGRTKAKVPLETIRGRSGERGRLVLVTGVNPTSAGEGKTTVSIGLADALTLQGHRAVLSLREPSLGPVFGIKGGAAGGGYSQVVPMDEINLHFTGDFHAIGSAHALLSAMVDNHLFRPSPTGLDPRRVTWRRAVDMNDRALRSIIVGLGGPSGGVPREDGFVITAASEVMAILALADDLQDLETRLGRIVVGWDRSGSAVRASDLGAEGAMTLLLRDALAPNLVQTLGGTPALLHCGPFANIAHGCSSLQATRAGLALGSVVVTEAGFGADLGAEKFLHIKCRAGGLAPDAVVVAATIRSMKLHGGAPPGELEREEVGALERGFANLARHVENVRKFGIEPIVALNRFPSDTVAEGVRAAELCAGIGVVCIPCDPFTQTGTGCLELAGAVSGAMEGGKAAFRPLYGDEASLREKIGTVAREIYRAEGVDILPAAEKQLAACEAIGLGHSPVCMAKTQYSFSDNPSLLGAPTGFRLTVREVTPAAGADFVVVRTGEVMTMPGLPERPAAVGMRILPDGRVEGLS
jgi:formate--tetrahydrofolate ligase